MFDETTTAPAVIHVVFGGIFDVNVVLVNAAVVIVVVATLVAVVFVVAVDDIL